MGTFRMEMSTDNAAFEDEREFAEVFSRLLDKMRMGRSEGPILDSNGNTVGKWEIAE